MYFEKLMKTTTVAILMHQRIDNYRLFEKKVSKELSRLIEEENAETFLFSAPSYTEYYCAQILKNLKRYYPLIKCVYVKKIHEDLSESDEKFLFYNFDEICIPEIFKSKSLYYNRYRIMVEKCDILVTYYEINHMLLKGKLSTIKSAVEYALKENKRIINLADELKK